MVLGGAFVCIFYLAQLALGIVLVVPLAYRLNSIVLGGLLFVGALANEPPLGVVAAVGLQLVAVAT